MFRNQIKYIKLVRSVMNTEQGQELLASWVKKYVYNHGINTKDANDTFVQLGERNFVLKLLSDLKIDPLKLEEEIKKYEQ